MADWQGFLFGGNTGLTADALKRRQAAAAAIAAQRRPFPKTFGEGLTYLGEAVGQRINDERLRGAEAGQLANDQALRAGAMGGGAAAGGAAPAVTDATVKPVAPPAGLPMGHQPIRNQVTGAVTDALMNQATSEVAQVNPTLPGAEPPVQATAFQAATRSSPSGQVSGDIWQRRQNAIGGIESGGEEDPYSAVGVQTNGDRPYGRYQVMGRNIPQWTQAALGRAMSPREFLGNKEAQDAVFRHRFGGYVDKYGEEGAARAWFAGEGNMNNLNGRDRLGTSVGSYGQRYMQGLNGRLSGVDRAKGGVIDDDGIPDGDNTPDAFPMARLPVELAAASTGTISDAPMPGAARLTPSPPVTDAPNPPTPTDIKPLSVRTQVAQAPKGIIPGSVALPGALFSPESIAGATGKPPGAPVTPELDPVPTPLKFPDPGPEPTIAPPTAEMQRWRAIVGNPYASDTLKKEAADRYKELYDVQKAEWQKRYERWSERTKARQEYELADPKQRLELAKSHYDALKARRDLEGEGFFPLTKEETAALGVPAGQVAYKNRRGELKFGPAPGTTVNVGDKATSKGLETLEVEMAKTFVEGLKEGNSAVDDLRTLNEMRVLAGRVPTGAGAVARQALGRMGIKTEGVSDIEAFDALINRVTPQQRVPGSGATSDFDARMFRASIPGLMNTPEGNSLIMDTMEGLAKNKLARAEIAGKVISRQLTMAEGTQELMRLQADARALSDRVKEHVEKSGAALPKPVLKDAEDAAAYEWLKANPNHEAAPGVRKRLGM